MFCKNCGSEILKGAKFCAKCGQEITYASESFDYKQEDEYAYANSNSTPLRRPANITALIVGIIGVVALIFSTYGYICLITGFAEATGFAMLLFYSLLLGGLAIIFGSIFVASHKEILTKLKYIGLILGIVDVAGSIIILIIFRVAVS